MGARNTVYEIEEIVERWSAGEVDCRDAMRHIACVIGYEENEEE